MFAAAKPSITTIRKKSRKKATIHLRIATAITAAVNQQLIAGIAHRTSRRKAKGPKWCDGLETAGEGSGSGGSVTKDGVEYKKVFSNPNGFRILYDESTLSLKGNSKNFRIVVSERANNKTQYKVIENGEVVATGSEVKAAWLANSSGQASTKEGVDEHQAAMSKYIVGDTMKQNIPKSAAKNVTIQKTDDDQMEMALNIARQTDEYKEMSDAEKKEFEETVKQGIAKNNEMAGTSYNIPASQGGTVAMVNGYFLVVKERNMESLQCLRSLMCRKMKQKCLRLV